LQLDGQAVTQNGPPREPEVGMALCAKDDPTVHIEFEELLGPMSPMHAQREFNAGFDFVP
jgi:hypothetical protein